MASILSNSEGPYQICLYKKKCMAASTASFKRLISPEREGFRGSKFDRFLLGLYLTAFGLWEDK